MSDFSDDGDLFAADPFPPTLAAAQARLAAVRAGDYARTRNHLDGAVTRLSPYITHGLLTLPQVLATLQARQTIDPRHKLVYELAWRAYFQHVWEHAGDAIFSSLHAGVLPDEAYACELPDDIRRGATGVPVIDRAVRTLYAQGWLHNHARMWLASYVVHLRKVHWRAGADWLYGHLLDGDLASNHLSWQWIAGTGSHQPYLFNADNVARHAPAAWHSPRSVVDQSYEALDRLARRPHAVAGGAGQPVDEPPLLTRPPADIATAAGALPAGSWLVHPWSLGGVPAGSAPAALWSPAFHQRWPWSAARWRFVATRMQALAGPAHWHTDVLPPGCTGWADLHLGPALDGATLQPASRLFSDPGRRCASFSQFWNRVSLLDVRSHGSIAPPAH